VIKRHEHAGKPGFAPYPVFYSDSISRNGIRTFAAANDLELVAEYADGYVRPGFGIVRKVIHGLKKLVAAVSLGRLTARHTNLLYILRKRDIHV
jgi:hypothetical protein